MSLIGKYLDAFPYSLFFFSEKSKFVFYLKSTGDSKDLMMLDLDQSTSLENGIKISNEDFSKRGYGPITFDLNSNTFYFYSDENNKENYNIFSLNVKSQNLVKISDTRYCGIFGFNCDHTKLIYGDRYNTENGKFFTRLYILNLESKERTFLVDDFDWEYRLSWTNVLFDEFEKNIFIVVDQENLRRQYNLLQVDLTSKATTLLLPKSEESSFLYPFGKKVRGSDLYFYSRKDGYGNLYHFDLSTKATEALTGLERITGFKKSDTGFHIEDDNETVTATLAEDEKDQTSLVRFRLNGAKKPTVESLVLRGAHRIVVSDSLWISNSNFDLPLTFSEYDFKNWPNAVNASKKISAVVGDVDQLVHNIYRYIEYPSFDQKKVSTFLSIPKKEVRGAIIVSFYGGTNQYSWLNQLFAELGFIVMSPAVRGSWSKSSEWRDLIKGDLGGNEILDLHWAAKYLEKEFGFTPSQIGVYGGSHGGYAVLRALTMPKGFNGLAESAYPYGFGLCWAGFADLEDFYKTSNIPDWLVGMLGPYEGNEKKYRERSPLHDFENLKAPLFISHGTNDARVSPTSMDGFIEKLKHSKKNYVLHMMSGLGHGGGSKAEELEEYSKMVRFLKELPKPAKQG